MNRCGLLDPPLGLMLPCGTSSCGGQLPRLCNPHPHRLGPFPKVARIGFWVLQTKQYQFARRFMSCVAPGTREGGKQLPDGRETSTDTGPEADAACRAAWPAGRGSVRSAPSGQRDLLCSLLTLKCSELRPGLQEVLDKHLGIEERCCQHLQLRADDHGTRPPLIQRTSEVRGSFGRRWP